MPTPLLRAAHAVAVVLVNAALGAMFGYALPGCPNPTPPGYPSPEALAQYALQNQTCVSASTTRVAAEECLTATRVAFCSQYPALAACVTDGGSHD